MRISGATREADGQKTSFWISHPIRRLGDAVAPSIRPSAGEGSEQRKVRPTWCNFTSMASHSLNAKQARFAEEYACDLNGTQAAKRTGYSPHAAAEQASHLLTLPKVRARVAELQAATSARIELSHDDILRDLITLRDAAAEAGQFGAAVRATEMLGRHIGMWPTRVEIARPEDGSDQQAARDAVQTVIADVISIITNHKLGLPLDPVAAARCTADDPELACLAAAHSTEPRQGRTGTDAADVPIAARYVLARSDS